MKRKPKTYEVFITDSEGITQPVIRMLDGDVLQVNFPPDIFEGVDAIVAHRLTSLRNALDDKIREVNSLKVYIEDMPIREHLRLIIKRWLR